ncbi:MAG: S41 family peptidase [Rikenellaceae bacterium]|jgi:carboxyl-terminal processing protease|nr:S41 family peptidase [Rikenellaceae bacterium]
MTKKLKYTLLAIVGAGVVAVSTAAVSSPDFKLGQNVEMLVAMLRNIWFYYVDEVDADTLGKNAAAGMVRGLDPYTELIHADDMSDFELMTTGKYGGIGSLIRQKGDWVQIAQPYKGSPADRAGLEIGDTFLEVEGRDARGMTTAKVSATLKGEAGTNVTIKVRKFYTGEEQTLSIRREVIALPAIPYYGMVGKGVGYIHHSDFTDGCADELRAALADLRARGARSLILDYRGNGGGIMQEAVKILALFVPKGTEVLSMRGRGEGSNHTYLTATEPIDTQMPIVVLTNGYTASSAEIVAGALQDLDRAVLVGQRTFGKGLVQSTLPVGFNSYLKLTTAKYYIPSGRCVQAIDYSHRSETGGVGFVPDSLVREFRTAGGRRVYDGGGVMPDVRLEPEYNSRFAVIAYSKGYIDEFVDEWSLENRSREVSPRGFALTDADYAMFVEAMRPKDFGFESVTAEAIRTLRRSAERERYIEDIAPYIDQIEAALRDDNEANLAHYRTELTELIEDGIILRRHYEQGVSEHNLVGDKAVAQAVAIATDPTRYTEITTTKDTDRK